MMKMKLIRWLVFILLLAANPVNAAQEAMTERGETVILKSDGTWERKPETKGRQSKQDFRKATWGMSKQQVKATEEEGPQAESEKGLNYKDEVAGMEASVVYIFAEGKLVKAAYILRREHSNSDDHITDYERVLGLLKKKYGEPKKENIIWKKDTFRDRVQRWGMAVSIGELVYYAAWERESTNIEVSLSGENFEVVLKVIYYSRALEALDKRVREQEQGSEL